MGITNNKAWARPKPLLFSGLIVAAPLAVGGVHLEVVLALLGASLAYWCLELGLFANDSRPGSTTVSLPLAAFWLFTSWCVLQLIPLPASIHRVLDPAGWEIYSKGHSLLFGNNSNLPWHSLSLEPAATTDRALRWLCLGVFGIVAASFAERRDSWRFTLRAVIVAGIVELGVGFVQHVAGTDAVLFIYQPTEGTLSGFTTFINTNHAAVFYGLVSLASFALCIHSYRRSKAEASIAALLGVAFMIAMTEHDSQGAEIAYWLSVAVMGLVLVMRVRQTGRLAGAIRDHFLALVFAIAIGIPSIVAAGLHWGPPGLRSALWSSSFGHWLSTTARGRYALVEAAIAAARQHLWVGAGAGATESVLPPYIDWSQIPAASIPTIENQPFEWLFTLGLPVTLIGLVLLASFFVIDIIHHKARHRTRLLAVFAIGLYLLINLQFHFPFFTMGLAVPFVSLLVVGLHSGRNSSRVVRLGKIAFFDMPLQPLRRAFFGCLISGAAFGGFYYGAFDAPSWVDKAVSLRPYERRQWLRPADGQLYARAALRADRHGQEQEAIELIDYAYRREPKASIRLIKAHLSAKVGEKVKAIQEYQALFADGVGRRPSLQERARHYLIADLESAKDRAQALRDASPREWRTTFNLIRRQRGTSEAILFAHALIELRPRAYEPRRLVGMGYLAQKNYVLAEMWARQLIAQEHIRDSGSSHSGYSILVSALFHQGRREDARALVAEQAEALRQDEHFWRSAAGYLLEPKAMSSDTFAWAIRNAYDAWCGSPIQPKMLRSCWLAEAWLAERSGELKAAEWAYRRLLGRFNQPKHLIFFYSRHFRCKRLVSLKRELLRQDPSVTSIRVTLQEEIRACHEGTD